MTVDATAQVLMRRGTGMIRWTYLQPTPLSRAVYTNRERRAQRDSAFNLAATLELQLKSHPTKNAMLTLLNAWLYAAEQQDLEERQPDYVHAVRYAIDVMTETDAPEDAIQILRETEPNVRFIAASAGSLKKLAAQEKDDPSERFIFERKGRRWTWKCVNHKRESIRTAEHSFAYYLDCYVDAKLNGFAGRPFVLVPGKEVVSCAMR